MDTYVYIYIYIYIYRERERDRETETDRQTDIVNYKHSDKVIVVARGKE